MGKPTFTERMDRASDSMNDWGNRLTKGLTWPIILFVLGLLTFPLGIILWLIGLGLFVDMFKKKEEVAWQK